VKIVIDTETTWYDEVMSIGEVGEDSDTMSWIQTKFYIIDPVITNRFSLIKYNAAIAD